MNWQKFFSISGNNVVLTLVELVKYLKIKISPTDIYERVIMHPDYPSLLSISDFLTRLDVNNISLYLDAFEKINDVPTPFIAHLNDNYVVVKRITDKKVICSINGNNKIYSKSEFQKAWSGVILIAENSNFIKKEKEEIKRNYNDYKLFKTKIVLLCILVVLAICTLVLKSELTIYSTFWFFLLTRIAGMAVCVLLLIKKFGLKNDLADSICNLGSKTDCKLLLNANGAKIFGLISLTDVGFVYFLGGLLCVITSRSISDFILNEYISVVALSFTVYSIYYQGIVVKKWCTLCLVIQLLLFLEGIWSLSHIKSILESNLYYTNSFLCYTLTVCFSIIIDSLFSSISEGNVRYESLMEFKRNLTLFKSNLFSQPRMLEVSAELNPITIGNEDAKNVLTIVTDPFCLPCSRVHKDVKKLLDENENIKIQIVFSACDEKRVKIVHQFLSNKDSSLTNVLLESWFEQDNKDYNVWLKNNNLDDVSDISYSDAYKHCIWVRKAGISKTPTIYLNSYELPSPYKINDLNGLLSTNELLI